MSAEGTTYGSINIVGLIGDPGCPVKVTLVIIYAKDATLLAACHKTVLVHLLFNPFLLTSTILMVRCSAIGLSTKMFLFLKNSLYSNNK